LAKGVRSNPRSSWSFFIPCNYRVYTLWRFATRRGQPPAVNLVGRFLCPDAAGPRRLGVGVGVFVGAPRGTPAEVALLDVLLEPGGGTLVALVRLRVLSLVSPEELGPVGVYVIAHVSGMRWRGGGGKDGGEVGETLARAVIVLAVDVSSMFDRNSASVPTRRSPGWHGCWEK